MRFKELMYSAPMNVTNVYRYQGVRMANPEPLTEHLISVMTMGSIFINECLKQGAQYNGDLQAEFLKRVFYHDMVEVMTNDLVRPVKYHSEKIRSELKTLEVDIATDFANRYFGTASFTEMINDKDDTTVGLLMKVFDMLDVARKVLDEVNLCGNMVFLKVAYEVDHYLDIMYKELRDGVPYADPVIVRGLTALVLEASESVSGILRRHKQTMFDFRIDNRSLVK